MKDKKKEKKNIKKQPILNNFADVMISEVGNPVFKALLAITDRHLAYNVGSVYADVQGRDFCARLLFTGNLQGMLADNVGGPAGPMGCICGKPSGGPELKPPIDTTRHAKKKTGPVDWNIIIETIRLQKGPKAGPSDLLDIMEDVLKSYHGDVKKAAETFGTMFAWKVSKMSFVAKLSHLRKQFASSKKG